MQQNNPKSVNYSAVTISIRFMVLYAKAQLINQE